MRISTKKITYKGRYIRIPRRRRGNSREHKVRGGVCPSWVEIRVNEGVVHPLRVEIELNGGRGWFRPSSWGRNRGESREVPPPCVEIG